MCDTDEAGEDKIKAGKLNLVDLAGSERQAKTGRCSVLFSPYFSNIIYVLKHLSTMWLCV